MGAVVLVFVAALALIAGLSRGPMSLSFVEPYVVQILQVQYPEVKFDFSNLELEWNGRDKNLMVAIDNLEISDETRKVASIPDVTMVFSGEALLRGRIAPAELEFTGLKIRLTRNKAGEIKFGYEHSLMAERGTSGGLTRDTDESAEDVPVADEYLNILNELSKEPDPESLTGYLQRLELYDSAVFIEDEILGRFWRVTGADVFVWRENRGLSGQASGLIKVGNENVSVVAFGDYDRDYKRTRIDGQFSDLPLPLVGAQVAELDILKGVKLSLSGHVNADLDEKFSFDSLGFDVTAGAGEIDLPELYKEPLSIDSLSVSGEVTGDFRKITLESVTAETLGTSVVMEGVVDVAEAGTGLTLAGSLRDLAVDNLGRFWPYSMASNGYDWVTKNIRGGKVPQASFTIDLPPGALESGEIPKDSVVLKFDIKGTSADYYSPLPKVTDIDGSAVLTETGVSITGMTGKLGSLDVTSDKVIINEFDKYDQLADIAIRVTGSSREIFTFLDLEPLGLATPYGIVPSAMTGTGTVDASFKFPLRFDLQLENVKYAANGDFTEATIPDVAENYTLTKGALNVAVDPKGVQVSGTAALNDVPAKIEAESWFTGAKEGHRRYVLTATPDDAARKALHLDTSYLAGPMKAKVTLETIPDGRASGAIKLDLTDTEIKVDALHWTKAASVAGQFAAEINSTAGDVTTLSNIAVTAGDLVASGTAILKEDLLAELTLPSVRYGENDFGLVFSQAQLGKMAVKVRGAQFDLKPFVVATYDLNEVDVDGPEENRLIDIHVDMDRVLLDHDLTLDNVAADMSIDGNLITTGMAQGKFKGEKSFDFEIIPSAKGRLVTFISDDAGSLFRGLDLYDDFRDGNLKLTAEIDDSQPSRPAEGTVAIKDVRVVNAPVLGKILTLGSLGGIVDLLRGEGMVFATVEGPFTYENGIFTTKDFRAIGSIGITLTGTVDQPANKIDMFGTVIPSYTLNSMLGNIPILGTLLVGKKGEGIFGFSYKVRGGLEDPDISVNAVSALAPGILRRMFFEPWDQDDIQPPSTNKPNNRQSP
ncbi:AsmA-like C-terminal domain-containing protein [Sneathiella sp. CAU 1612]|uniref:AsmA-like C-terminal domain-containing protein n=1 Tax=Sneathiella sedimenti TaxID=2816034 RepID=A0ABS3F7Q5_9PROT|nr:AsmA-like C-terminal domain-containing protein [Sneathiella sedimenti]MBO0334540.1 AsmA-like C-terminal domain-containing protein [Sneathiella sedimenti]